uniref:Uncharacterized protein n=1 Tax=Trichogramma kaykai TaxID=54128 RepID=A0ABD2X507_9HYME
MQAEKVPAMGPLGLLRSAASYPLLYSADVYRLVEISRLHHHHHDHHYHYYYTYIVEAATAVAVAAAIAIAAERERAAARQFLLSVISSLFPSSPIYNNNAGCQAPSSPLLCTAAAAVACRSMLSRLTSSAWLYRFYRGLDPRPSIYIYTFFVVTYIHIPTMCVRACMYLTTWCVSCKCVHT